MVLGSLTLLKSCPSHLWQVQTCSWHLSIKEQAISWHNRNIIEGLMWKWMATTGTLFLVISLVKECITSKNVLQLRNIQNTKCWSSHDIQVRMWRFSLAYGDRKKAICFDRYCNLTVKINTPTVRQKMFWLMKSMYSILSLQFSVWKKMYKHLWHC